MWIAMRIAAYLLVGGVVLSGCGGPDGRFLRVENGSFKASFSETGELQAANYNLVVMPYFRHSYGQPKIEHLEKEGTTVKRGDVVGKIETLGVEREFGQKKVDLGIAEGELSNLQVKQKGELDGLQGQLRQSQNAERLAQMDTQRVAFESPNRRSVERLKYLKSEYALRKIEGQIKDTRRIQAEDLLIKEANLRQIRSDIAKAERALELFTLRAPADGMVEYREYRRGRKVAVGDQVWRGTPIIGLPDMSQMKVLTTVNETDIGKVRVGLPVSVRLDAYPLTAFDGQIITLSRISRRKDGKSLTKVFDAEVLLAATDPILRPGMTVSCEFLFANLDEALWVHPSCVYVESGVRVVYVKETLGVRPVPVEIGPRHPDAVVVFGDLRPGDRVLAGPAQVAERAR